MTCHRVTQQAITKMKTQADVKKDLYNLACANARKLLREKTGKDLPATAELDDIMYPLAQWKFKDEFSFDFEKDYKVYPQKNLLEGLQGDVTPVAQLCSITEGSDIDGFIDTVLLSKVDLPTWMSGNAKGALKTLAKRLTSQDTSLHCQFNGYQQSFDGQNEDQDSWKAKSVIVYLTGSLMEDSLSANITIVYFLAVYYKVKSPTYTIRCEIQNNAITTARSFTGDNSISNTSNLSSALTAYSSSSFLSHFGFAVKSLKPPGFIEHGLLTSNSHLFYFPDLVTGDLEETINGRLFQGLDIPDTMPAIKEKALNEIVTHFKEVVKDPISGAWSDSFISKTYSPLDPAFNPVCLNVAVVHFYDHKTTDTQVKVSNSYILCLALFWEVLSTEKIIAQDILKSMVHQLCHRLGHTDVSAEDPHDFKDILLEYAKKQFFNNFQFEYNGNQSRPLDLFAKNHTVIGMGQLAAFHDYPVATSAVTEWIDAEFFQRNSSRFPPEVRGQLYDDLKDDLMYYTKHFPEDSSWTVTNRDRSYLLPRVKVPKSNSKGDSKDGKKPAKQEKYQSKAINVSTTYVSGLGDLSLKGVRKQMPFVYVLMVVRSAKANSW